MKKKVISTQGQITNHFIYRLKIIFRPSNNNLVLNFNEYQFSICILPYEII